MKPVVLKSVGSRVCVCTVIAARPDKEKRNIMKTEEFLLKIMDIMLV